MTRILRANRREFLKQLGSAGLVLSCPVRIFAQESLPTRTIPRTTENLPVIGLGSTKPVLEIPTNGPEAVAEVIQMLLAHGGRVVDTSPRNEDIDREFGHILQQPKVQNQIFLATKINTPDLETGVAQMRQTQRLFGRQTMDLVQIESLRGLEGHWRNLRQWKDTGEARHIGVTVSNYSNHERLEAFMKREPLDFIHVNYSVMEPLAEERLLPLAQDRGMGVLVNRPFMNGTYFGRVNGHILPDWTSEFDCESWAQFSLKYILAHPAVTCVLTETTNPMHMEENIRAAFKRLPNELTKKRMRELVHTF